MIGPVEVYAQTANLISSGINASAVLTAIAVVVSIFQFISVRKHESRQREFERYHWLIEHLVTPDSEGRMLQDRQTAIAFELRHFPRYYPCTERILSGLGAYYASFGKPEWAKINKEIELTLRYIRAQKGFVSER